MARGVQLEALRRFGLHGVVVPGVQLEGHPAIAAGGDCLHQGGTVVVTETKVPDGYVLDSTPQTIIVKNGSNSVNSGTVGGTTNGNTGGCWRCRRAGRSRPGCPCR